MTVHHQVEGTYFFDISVNIHQIILAFPFLIVFVLYLLTSLRRKPSQSAWPKIRLIIWFLGNLFILSAVIGPLANLAHHHFVAHMLGHLLLGMLGPLLITLAAPLTLLLRSIPVKQARKLTRFLKSHFIRWLTDPVITSILNVGGLWLLYSTDLYPKMHSHAFLHIVIHLHVFLAGYLFTSSFITVEPVPHRRSFIYRSVVLILALSAHGILAKYIYAVPINGVPESETQVGAMLMYYGGDAVEIILIIIFCYQWYQQSRPMRSQTI